MMEEIDYMGVVSLYIAFRYMIIYEINHILFIYFIL